MAGPWEKYAGEAPAAASSDGPWAKYAAAPPPTAKGEAKTPERFQWWPERFVRGIPDAIMRIGSDIKSGATLPHDVMTGEAKMPSSGAVPGSVPFGDPQSSGERVADLATLAAPGALRMGKEAVIPPTRDALKAAAQASYKEAAGLGIELETAALGRVAKSIEAELKTEGYRDYLAPKTFRAIAELSTPAGKNATLHDIDGVRKLLGRAGADPMEKDAVRIASQRIDEYLENIPKDHVVSRNPEAVEKVGDILRAARGNYAPMKRADLIEDAASRAERQAASTGSGANIDNALRQKFRALRDNPKKMRGFSDEEKTQIDKIINGTFTGNAARLIGKLAPTGVVSAVPTGLAALAGGPAGAAGLAGLGLGGKALSDFLTKKGVRDLDSLIRSRSQLAKDAPPPASFMQSGTPFSTPLDAILRMVGQARP